MPSHRIINVPTGTQLGPYHDQDSDLGPGRIIGLRAETKREGHILADFIPDRIPLSRGTKLALWLILIATIVLAVVVCTCLPLAVAAL